MANNKCKECGCTCKKCIASDHDVQLHVEIENLKQKLFERENHIVTMETNFLNEANKFPNGEMVAMREELLTWQDKYKRLYDAHRRVQRVNQGLEDKLLKLVDVCETEKNTLTKDVATLSHKLAEANYSIKKLTEDNERYKNDVSLAIQFLQCKQSNFVVHKFDSLPVEVQTQVSTYMTNKRKPEEKKSPLEIRSIKVPIPTFPPTAMVYSVPKSPKPDRKVEADLEAPSVDIVSAAIMAKVLEERQRERALAKHCDTCTCAKTLKIIYDHSHHNIGTQTGDYKEMLCLRCNEGIQATSTGMKLVRNLDPKIKKMATYSIDSTDNSQNVNNIVKVQPNNFLIDNKSKTNSNSSSLIDLTSNPTNNTNSSVSPKNIINPNIHVIGSELSLYQDVTFRNISEQPEKKETQTQNKTKLEHHHLCDKTSPTYEVECTVVEKADSEKNLDKSSAKNASSENLRGPRYCSMRLQSGTRNILLDNAHNNIAPVLYTRSHKIKREEPPKTHESNTESSSECRNNSLLSDNSVQNQQRVADWIQSNLDVEVSSSENSRSDSVKYALKARDVDKVKYAEMEENVKRFLFGESEFMKTVEIGKLKYQNFREGDDSHCVASTNSSPKNSHTETEI